MKIDLPRAIYAQGKMTVLYLMMWILAAGIVIDGTMFILLDRTVLSRLAQLSLGVGVIGRLGKISARVHFDGNDELTTLGRAINDTFDALENAEKSLKKTNSELEDRVRRRTVQLAASKEAAEAASRAKSDFMQNVSHELRTPMNGIIGMLDMALDTAVNAELSEYLETARFSATAMMTVISDILDFSKLDAGQLNLHLAQFSIVDCVATSLETHREQAARKDLTLIADVARAVPQILVGDPARMEQILLNLIGNAIKFTEQGQVAVRVQIKSEAAEEVELHFAVSDTGIGIRPEKQQQIFERFTQVDNSSTRRHGGLGLGLTICSQLVKEMRGRIWIESKLGAGSTFHFTARLTRTLQLDPAPVAALK
jgi:signal transduction histidine kinase